MTNEQTAILIHNLAHRLNDVLFLFSTTMSGDTAIYTPEELSEMILEEIHDPAASCLLKHPKHQEPPEETTPKKRTRTLRLVAHEGRVL